MYLSRPSKGLDVLKIEICSSVVIANIRHYFTKPFLVLRQLAIFYVFAYEIAQDASEILMSWKRKKTS